MARPQCSGVSYEGMRWEARCGNRGREDDTGPYWCGWHSKEKHRRSALAAAEKAALEAAVGFYTEREKWAALECPPAEIVGSEWYRQRLVVMDCDRKFQAACAELARVRGT